MPVVASALTGTMGPDPFLPALNNQRLELFRGRKLKLKQSADERFDS